MSKQQTQKVRFAPGTSSSSSSSIADQHATHGGNPTESDSTELERYVETAIYSLESDMTEEKLIGLLVAARYVIPTMESQTQTPKDDSNEQISQYRIRLFHATTPQFLQELLVPLETGVVLAQTEGELGPTQLAKLALVMIGFFARENELIGLCCELLPDLNRAAKSLVYLLKESDDENLSMQRHHVDTLIELSSLNQDVWEQFVHHGDNFEDFPWASIVDYSVSIIYSLAFACSSSQTDISQEHLNSLQAQLEFHSKSLSNLFASIYNYHDVDAFDIMRPSTLDTLFEMLGFHFRVCPQAILHNILLVCLSWSQLSMNPEDRAHRQTPYFRHALDSGRKTLLQFLQSRLPDSLLSGLLQLISGLCRLFSPKWMLGHQSETELVHTHAEDNRCENVDRQTSIPESIRFLLLVVRISGVELKLSLDSAETCLVQHVDEGGVVGQDTNEGDDRSAEEKIMTEREMSSLATGRYGGSFGSSNTEHVPEDLRPPKNVPYKSVEPLSREKRASKAFHDYESLMLTIISCCEILESTMDFVSKYASVEPQQDGDGNKNPLSGLDYESVASIKSAFHSPFEVCHSFLLAIKDSEIYPFVCDISGAVNIFQMATDVSPAVFNTWTDKKSLCSKEGRATAVSLLYIPSIKFVCSFAFEDTEAYALEVSELAELLLFSKKLSLKAMDRMNLHDQIKLSMVLPFISGTDAPILDLPIVYAFPLFLNRLHQEVLLDRFMDLHGELLCMDWLLQWSRAVAIAVMEMQSQETQERSSPSALSVLSLDLSSTVLQILLMLNEKRASDQEKREICGLDTEKLKPVADSLFKLDLKLKTNVKLFYNNKNVFVGFIHWTHALACLLCDIFDSDCQLVECAWQIYDKESSLKILRSIGTSAACPLWQFHRLQNEPFGDESYSKLWESLLKRIGKICAQQTKYSESFKSLMKEPVRRSFGKQLEQYIRLVATENKWGDKAPSSDTTVTQWLFQQIEGIEREISNASEAIGDELQDVKNLLESIQRCIE